MIRPLFVPTLLMIVMVAVATTAASQPTASRRAHLHRPSGASADISPKRIVSLAPVVTETLFRLGLGKRVVGVTRFCDRPLQAKQLPKVGGFIDPQLEAIVALKPDLVVSMPSNGVRTTLDRLREQGVPVLVVFGDTMEEVRDLIASIGRETHTIRTATDLVMEFDQALKGLRRPPPPSAPRILILVGVRPLIAAGPGTFADEAVNWVGGRRSLDDDAPAWPTLSVEAIGALAPDVIIAAGGAADAKALEGTLAPLGDRRPKLVHGKDAFLMRPGPSLHKDVAILDKIVRTHVLQETP